MMATSYWWASGSPTGTAVFNLIIDGMADGTNCLLHKCASDAQLGGAVTGVQRDFGSLENRADRNFKMFSKSKYKALQLG